MVDTIAPHSVTSFIQNHVLSSSIGFCRSGILCVFAAAAEAHAQKPHFASNLHMASRQSEINSSAATPYVKTFNRCDFRISDALGYENFNDSWITFAVKYNICEDLTFSKWILYTTGWLALDLLSPWSWTIFKCNGYMPTCTVVDNTSPTNVVFCN